MHTTTPVALTHDEFVVAFAAANVSSDGGVYVRSGLKAPPGHYGSVDGEVRGETYNEPELWRYYRTAVETCNGAFLVRVHEALRLVAPTPPATPASALRVCETIVHVRDLQERRVDPPYTPDWTVQVVVDHGRGNGHYRWLVLGINTNVEPGGYGREICWRVPYLSWRYDLTHAQLMTASEALAYRIIDRESSAA